MKRENQIFTAPFMDAQLEKAAWKYLSEMFKEPVIDFKLMREHSDKLHWKSISENRSIKWNIDLLRKFAHLLEWKELTETIFNSRYYQMEIEKWRLEDVITLIDEFKDRWDWNTLSKKIYYPQSEELLERYASKLNWSNIADNEHIKWTFSMVSKFERYLADVEDLDKTNLWRELSSKRAEEIIAETVD